MPDDFILSQPKRSYIIEFYYRYSIGYPVLAHLFYRVKASKYPIGFRNGTFFALILPGYLCTVPFGTQKYWHLMLLLKD